MREMTGPLLIALAAILWATDAIFRFATVSSINASLIVLFEHLIGLVALLPWIFFKHRKDIFRLSAKEWISAAFIGVGGSAMATVLFTGSFRYINPSVTILLQKLQPILVVLIASIFLGERPKGRFVLWAALALVAGVVLSFPDFNFTFLQNGLDLHSTGVAYALSAAALWAVSTVVGKSLLRKQPPGVATFWRYAFGLITLVFLVRVSESSIPWAKLESTAVIRAILYMSLFPGLLAMLAYYAGLSRTLASVTTFVELLFPVSAVALNTFFLHMPLDPVQIGAALVLLISVTQITISER